MDSRQVTIMIKPTNDCNLRCKYCYNSECQYTHDIMDINTLKTLLVKAVDDYDKIHFIWHGGEPLLAGLNFYTSVIKVENEFMHNHQIEITNAMQTNGTLLDKGYSDFLITNGFRLGFSFDGEENETMRGQTQDTLRGMDTVKSNGNRISAIKVITKSDLNNIVTIYNYYNKLLFNIKMNPLFKCNLVKESEIYTAEEYSNAIKELFLYWINDANCQIAVQPMEHYLSILTGRGNISCEYTSCLSNFISVYPNGDIFPCSRNFPPEYCYGNINEMESLKHIYSSKGFCNILAGAVERRKKCIANCDLFPYCQGGCNNNALIEDKLDSNGFFSCLVFKSVFPYIKNYIENINITDIINLKAKRYFEL